MENTPRDSRINAIKVIYSCHMNDTKPEDVIPSIIDEANDTLAIKMALNVMSNIKEIDEIISNNLVGYSLNRLNVVDRSIIELATYEMMSDVAPAIAINEALEITKSYTDVGDKKEVKFNNKVLDNIAKNLKNKEK